MKVDARTDIHGYVWIKLASGGGYVMIQRHNFPMLPQVVSREVWASWEGNYIDDLPR